MCGGIAWVAAGPEGGRGQNGPHRRHEKETGWITGVSLPPACLVIEPRTTSGPGVGAGAEHTGMGVWGSCRPG